MAKEFLFDVKLLATVRVKAATRQEAEANVLDILNGSTCNAGLYADGSPVLFDATVDGELDLVEVDGEPT